MKQAILTFDRCRVLLVELPDNTVSIEPSYCHAIIWKDNTGYIETEYPLGEDSPCIIEPVGKLSELTEEQTREIVDSWQRYFPEQHTVYRNYEYPIEYDHIKGREQRWSHPFGNAVESFLSKLRADGFRCEFNHDEQSEFTGDRDADKALQDSYDVQQERGFTPDLTWVFTIKQ